jgi:hypothetical protein
MLVSVRLCSIILFTLFFSNIIISQQISIRDSIFLLDHEPFDMWGVRLASASQSESNTSRLVEALDEYNKVGINTISVYLQGSSGGYSDPFRRKGKSIDKDHWQRLVQIIEACADRRMVVIVGIFYQRTLRDDGLRQLQTAREIVRAASLVVRKLKPYQNVILNIANEQNSRLYQGFTAFSFNDPEQILSLCAVAKRIDPDRIVGAGGYNDNLNVIIGKSPLTDVLLFDTFSGDIEKGQDSGWHYDYFRKQGVGVKPLVNVEIFGGWTRKFTPQGVYTEEGKAIHWAEIKAAKARPGLSVHFHSNPWFQGQAQDWNNQFNLGGQGTPEDPGVRWFFDRIGSK